MEPKAENVVQNIGAIAETISVFYNSIARQVPKDVALALTQHFMDITISRQPAGPSPEARAVALAAEVHRQAMAQKRRQQKEALEQQKKAEQAKAEAAPEAPPETPPAPAPEPPQDPQPED